MPVGYEKSALGRQTVQRSILDRRFTPYTAQLTIRSGAAAAGHFIDGIRTTEVPVRFNSNAGSRNLALIVRGTATGLNGASAIKARIVFVDLFGNALNASENTVTPAADGSFTAIVAGFAADDTVTSMVANVGLGVAGAEAIIRLQSCHILQMTPYSADGSENWRVIADVWTKYPRHFDLQREYAKAGITARWDSHSQQFLREWLGSAPPKRGSYLRGDRIIDPAPAAGQAPGWVCVAAGTPGTWKPMAPLGS
jgi:hypothetical protein